ncbi:putative peptidoglycan binding domain protein [compost metagenome]
MKPCQLCPCDQLTPPAPAARFSLKAYQTRIAATLFSGKMDASQRACIGGFTAAAALLTHMGHDIPIQHLAYVLATTYHETAFTMRPVREYGQGEGYPYGEPDPATGETYYGRGYVQLTWKDNYARMSEKVVSILLEPVDLVSKADYALAPAYAAQIAVIGMSEGIFTGKKLSDYWLANGEYDYTEARRIINGTDRAETIAGYAAEFELAARLAQGQPIERNTVRMGSKGADVAELQLALGSAEVDGAFGNNTDALVKAFQSANGLTANGVADQTTWEALEKQVYGL